MSAPARGMMIAAPGSGSGKTTVTLGLLRALRRRGIDVAAAKAGPDYIDPHFHSAASGRPCGNIDAYAMAPDRCRSLMPQAEVVIVETAMGLYDGAPPDGRGSAAHLAAILDLPVILVVNAAQMAQSLRAIVAGFAGEPDAPRISGVVVNNVGSDRHARMIRASWRADLPPILGMMPRAAQIRHPSRHLGLVQAQERADLDQMIDIAADLVAEHLDLDAIQAACAPIQPAAPRRTAPPAQRIAMAQDRAFAFAYPHLLQDWRSQGAEILPFSPLADEAPPEADLIYLPGGYPELHAAQISSAARFHAGMHRAAGTTPIYGECGGYMALGDGLIDADGTRHAMLGLLPLETSFAQRRLHLGYRRIQIARGPFAGHWRGHEFHFATTLRADGPSLATAQDAEGAALGDQGLQIAQVQGSFLHLIDQETPDD